MKKILLLSLLTSLSILPVAHAEAETTTEKAPIFLSYCSHFGTGVSYSFQSCVNSNFSAVSRITGGFFQNCMNFGQEVDYGFTSCVNSGFREAQRQLDNTVWMQSCMNFDRKTLDYSFISCVNSNFSAIQREISSRP